MMLANKLTGALLTGVLAALSCVALGEDSDRAIDLLGRAQRGDFRVNVTGILLQQDVAGEGWQRVRVDRSKDGKQHCKILYPLRSMKVESIDDGVRKQTYMPDDNVIIDEDSRGDGAGGIEDRLRLAKRNYTFSIESINSVAGRDTVLITAKPRNIGIDVRRYYLDEKTAYPLKMETIGEGGKPVVAYQMSEISYPARLSPNLFKLDILPGVEIFKFERPTAVDVATARQQFGFTPVLPKSLPLGFTIQETQFNKKEDWQSIKVRLTDGLARATVYQWIPNGKPIKVIGDSTSMDVNGLRLLIVSELGPKVRARLLDAFIKAGKEAPKGEGSPLLIIILTGCPGRKDILELALGDAAFKELDAPEES